MYSLVDSLRLLEQIVLSVLGVIAVRRWLRQRTEAPAWNALTFVSLAIVVVAGSFVSEEPDAPLLVQIERIVVVWILAAFPYFVFRFAGTFTGLSEGARRTSAGLTGAIMAALLIAGGVPESGARRSAAFTAFVLLFVAQWVSLTAITSTMLWRSAQSQPTVVRMRMRMLSTAILLLALVLVVSAITPNQTDDSSAIEVAASALLIISTLMFVAASTPPAVLLTLWRRSDQAKLRAGTQRLIKAETEQDVADALLPPLVDILGTNSAWLERVDGTLIAAHHRGTPRQHLGLKTLSVPFTTGQLVVETTSYTPFYGQETEQLVTAVVSLADLALQRIESAEQEHLATEQVVRLNEAMKDLLASAAHDLRTPITVIRGFANAMAGQWGGLPDESRDQYLQSIVRQSDQLTRIVDDLFTLSKLDAHVVEVSPELIEVRELCNEVTADLRIADSVTIEIGEHIVVNADAHHLRRILGNYLENALNYGELPISVSTRDRDSTVEIRVCDSGPGIPDTKVDQIFERFEQGRTRGKHRSGSGLGLFIVKGLAEANGGRAWYEPNEPVGSVFCVSIPQAVAKG